MGCFKRDSSSFSCYMSKRCQAFINLMQIQENSELLSLVFNKFLLKIVFIMQKCKRFCKRTDDKKLSILFFYLDLKFLISLSNLIILLTFEFNKEIEKIWKIFMKLLILMHPINRIAFF